MIVSDISKYTAVPRPCYNGRMKRELFYGDNLEVMRRYIKNETVDLCYIDPPFNSKRNYDSVSPATSRRQPRSR